MEKTNKAKEWDNYWVKQEVVAKVSIWLLHDLWACLKFSRLN